MQEDRFIIVTRRATSVARRLNEASVSSYESNWVSFTIEMGSLNAHPMHEWRQSLPFLYAYERVIVVLDRLFTLGSIVGSPAIANSVLYVGSTDGTLYAIE